MKKGTRILLIAGALLVLVLVAGALSSLVLLPVWDSESSASSGQVVPGTSSQPSAATHSLASAGSANSSEPQGLSVSGEGRASAAPDMAVLGLGVSAKASTVSAANSQAQGAMTALLDSLKAHGIQEKDIQTSGLSINPEYDYLNNEQVLTGYRVSHMLQVKVRDIDRVGEVIDEAVQAGGDLLQIQSISLTIDDTTALRSQARQKAVADAQATAEELAALAGVTLGDPTYITESNSTPYTQAYSYDRSVSYSAEAAPATEISPGELEVVVYVQISYTIE
ncbi:MAG: SIMPL domain-containing protein [Dehalococcoidia bacterium]|nr:SIMPL domain-containing protein [Dehalococcoidia bacterium]